MRASEMESDLHVDDAPRIKEEPYYVRIKLRRPPPQLARLTERSELQHVVDNPQYILPHPAPVPSPVRPQGDQFVTSAVNSSIPALEEWPGQLQFKVNVRLPKITGRMIPAAYDSEARKLYVDLSMAVPFGFRVKEGYDTSQLRLRALPVYSDVHHVNTPVRRCPSHRERNHESNVDAGDHIEWVIRADNCNAKYEASGATEERRSVVVPFEAPQPGAGEFVVFYKFCCMNSCIGGINRRRLQVIFTLETIAGDTLGRGSVEVKVCKCPLRDYRNDLQRQNRSVQQQKPSKRRREPSPGRPRPGVFMLDCGTEAMYNHMKVVLNSLRGSIPEIAAQEQSQPARLVSRSPISSPQEQEGDDSSGELEPPTPVERRPPVGDIKMEFV